MRKLLLIAGVAVLAAPCLAIAQDDSMAPDASRNGADVAYTGGPSDLMDREMRLDRAIHEANSSGAIPQEDAVHDSKLLAAVRDRQDELASSHGGLTPDDRALLSRELDGVGGQLRLQQGGGF